MNFALILFIATAGTGIVWLADKLWLRKRRGQRKEGTLVEYSRALFPVLAIVFALRSFLVEPFRIPSGSMLPTLLIGDFILVNKFTYGIRLPVIDRKIIEIGAPERGDVVVFRYPLDPRTDYIKRIVGVPGDRIEYRNKTLFINGEPMPQSMVDTYVGQGSDRRDSGVQRRRENLLGVEHDILVQPRAADFPGQCLVLFNRPFIVPPGQYFAMGDNRDGSSDSRCWGTVPDENLVGRAFMIWMNFDSQRDSWVDWSRIGNSIR
ncbi:MAG: signal peptidase I [Chromatiales bacterium]|nr:signal peptidase I [Chromatiales bacterium]